MDSQSTNGDLAAELNRLMDEVRDLRRAGKDTNAYFMTLNILERSREAGLRKIEARALLRLANNVKWVDTGKNGFAESERLARESLAIFEELGDRIGQAHCWQLLASSSGRDKGRQMLQDALAVFQEEGDKADVAWSLDRLAAFIVFQDKEEMVRLRKEALAIYEEIGDAVGQGNVLFGLSVGEMSNREASRALAERALEQYRIAERPKLVAQMLMFLDDRDLPPDERIPRLEEGIRCCAESNSILWQASMMRSLAGCLEQKGQISAAAELRRDADLVHPETKMSEEDEKAFTEALESLDVKQMSDVLKVISVNQEDEEKNNGEN